MSIQAIWHLIRSHWLTLFVAGSLGVALGAAISTTVESQYSTRAEVFLAVANSSDAAGMAQGITYSQQQARNFAAVATRQLVLQPVADDLGGDVTVSELRAQVSASVPLNTSIVTIQATDPSPERAARVANAVATSLADSTGRLAPESEARASSVRVQSVEQATVPRAPSSPNVALWTLLGGLLGLLLGLLFVGVRDAFRARVRTAAQASAITHAPVLGIVSRRRRSQREPMVLEFAPNSPHAEQYRQIRANLLAMRTSPFPNVFVLTSSVPGEGRSTVAANIAATVAAAGIRVCLVEADLHRPSLASVLGLEPGSGLHAVLTGDAGLEEALQPWGPDGLQVLVAGATPLNPSELLTSPRAEECLVRIGDQFEVTLIDAPAVLDVTDAAILARMFGGAIMVVSERGVRVRVLERAVERMSQARTPLIGTILSMSSIAPRRKRLPPRHVGGSPGTTSGDPTARARNRAERRPLAPSGS